MYTLKNQEEIGLMKKSGAILIEVFRRVGDFIKPGVTTADVNEIVDRTIREFGAIPNFLGVGDPPYPAASCVSVNDEIVHGIPSPDHYIQDGDIVSVDIGANLGGWQSDACRTFMVGTVSPEVRKLVEVTEQCFWLGLAEAMPGKRLGDIGHAVQRHAERHGYSVVRELTGHGIGRELHEDPTLLNYGKPGRGLRLYAGMTLALEPMINMGRKEIAMESDDGWTIVTDDGSYSAHYENSFAVTDDGPILLTCNESLADKLAEIPAF